MLGGPVIGGAITQGSHGSGSSGSTSRSALLTIPVALRRVDESYGPRSAPDVVGLALVTGAALGIVWGLVRGNSAGWGSVEVIAALAAGALLAVAFVVWERRAAAPMLPMGLFASRPFSSGNAGGLLPVHVALRRGVLHGAVPPDRPAPRPARRRHPAAAVDGDVVHRRADHRRAGLARRRAPVRGRRAAAAGGRDGVDRADRRTRRRLLAAGGAAHDRGLRGVDGDARAAERGRELGVRRRASARHRGRST